MAGSNPSVVACIPAYNEERSIAGVIVQTKKFVDEVFVCDDGSTDKTGEIAEALGAIVIRHETKSGKGVALRDLFKSAIKAEADIVVTLDADGQHRPEDIPRLVEPIIGERADIVVGSRFVEGGKTDAPLYRRLGLSFFNGNGENGVRDTQSGLRVFSSKALRVVVKAEADGFGVETEQLTLAKKHGLRVVEVPVVIRYHNVGKTSKKNPFFHGVEIIGTMIRLVTEERPLVFFGIPAFLFLLVGLIGGITILFEYNQSQYFSLPWAFVFITGLVLGMTMAVAALVLYAISRLKSKS